MFVMHKPALVRVYVRNLVAPSGTAITGQLDVEGTFWAYETQITKIPFDPIAPGFASAVKPASYAAERGVLGASLNFIIPAELMSGNIKLTARIWRQVDGDPHHPDDAQVTAIGAHFIQTLSLRGIMVGYNGPDPTLPGTPNVNLAAPTVANLSSTAALALSNMPVSEWPRFSIGGNINWTTPLTGTATTAGGCSQQWRDLNAAVADARDNDGNRADVIYYGLLPGATPIMNVGGCESSGVASGADADMGTMAHEIGHACGLKHAPCGTSGDKVDAAYPAYEPYDAADTPSASLGEYGADIRTMTLRLPSTKDVMSYCTGDWFSLRNYKKLLFASKLNPDFPYIGGARVRPPVDVYHWPWDDPNPPDPLTFNPARHLKPSPIISVIAVETDRDQFEVRSVSRVTAVGPIEGTLPSDYVLQLLDGSDVLAEAPAFRIESCGACACACNEKAEPGPPYLIRAVLPDLARGSELRLVRRKSEARDDEQLHILWSRKAPKSEPRIAQLRAQLKRDKILIQWKASSKTEKLCFSLQFSKDGGRSWNGVTTGIAESSYELDATPLPQGDLQFRLLAHNGFHTVVATSNLVRNPARAPIPVILYPDNRHAIIPGQPLRLWGMCASRVADETGETTYHWRLDGKEVGEGSSLWIAAPPAGKHKCELLVGERGLTAKAELSFETVAPVRPVR